MINVLSAFNWCTQTQPNDTKGSGYFGIVVISKVPLTNLRFGIDYECLEKGEFMPIVEGRRRDLEISPCNTIIGVGDNRTITDVGKTLLRLNINGHVVERPVLLLQDCPYKLILGWKFFYEYSYDILFSSRCLQSCTKGTKKRHRFHSD
jgi:hypothetical protein